MCVTVPAILEHEAIAGLTGSKPAGLRGRSFSNTRDAGGQAEGNRHSLDILIRTVRGKGSAVGYQLVRRSDWLLLDLLPCGHGLRTSTYVVDCVITCFFDWWV